MAGFHVAIIGAGPAGLALALALHAQSISCAIYEARDAPLNNIGGGLVLAPNGLKVLQSIGIYDFLLDHSYAFGTAYVQLGPTGAIIDTIEYSGDGKFVVKALRAYRYTLLEQLLAKARAANIPFHFNRRFSHVLAETDTDVTWQFTDGSSACASILVGADGIRSGVREYVAPGIKPMFDGVVSLLAVVPTTQLGLPAEELADLNNANNKHPLPGCIVAPQSGAMILIPQRKSGDEVMISVMRPLPKEPEHWATLDADKERLRAMFREDADQFPEVVQNAVRFIPTEGLHVWPAYQIPLLERWSSGRVVIVGDAASALPPHAGQGVNQALESVYLLAGVLGALGGDFSSATLQAALRGWQLFRQERLDGVVRLTKLMQIARLPPVAQAREGINMDAASLKGAMNEEYTKLFSIDYPSALRECLARAHLSGKRKDKPGEPFTSSSL